MTRKKKIIQRNWSVNYGRKHWCLWRIRQLFLITHHSVSHDTIVTWLYIESESTIYGNEVICICNLCKYCIYKEWFLQKFFFVSFVSNFLTSFQRISMFETCHDIAEILLKMVLNTNQSINQSINHIWNPQKSLVPETSIKMIFVWILSHC